MVRNYKKKEQGGRTNYSKDPHMVAAYNAVMAGEMPTAVEREIAECIVAMADWGWGFSTTEVRDIIQDFVKS